MPSEKEIKTLIEEIGAVLSWRTTRLTTPAMIVGLLNSAYEALTAAEQAREADSVACVERGSPQSTPQPDSRLREAAKMLIKRWDTPVWKDAEPTASLINELRAALAQGADDERS